MLRRIYIKKYIHIVYKMHDGGLTTKVLTIEHILVQLMQRIAYLESVVASKQTRRDSILSQISSSVPDDL